MRISEGDAPRGVSLNPHCRVPSAVIPALSEQFDRLRRRLRRAGIVRGAALAVVALIAAAAVAGAVDVLTRSGSTAFRLLLTIAALLPAGWVVATRLIPPLRSRPSDVELARRAERVDSSWKGRLSAAAAFQQATPLAGSTTLQQRIVGDVTRQLTSRPLPDLVHRPSVTRPLLAAGAVTAVAILIAAFAPGTVGTALSRLALPLSPIEWPRDVDLVVLTENGEPLPDKLQIGRGQSLRFLVRNTQGNVPGDLTLQIVPPDGRPRSEPMPMIEGTAESGTPRTIGSGVLLAEAGPLRFRVVGGDHRDMPFLTADVVPPPIFQRIQVTVTPPDYLGATPVTSPEGVGSVTGVVGSSVTVKARTNKPLAVAELRVGDQPGPPVTLSESGRDVVARFTLDEPGYSSYWFQLRDRGGFENPQAPRYELRVTADEVPVVTIAEPADDLTATPAADLPVVVEASDDQGLIAVRLRFARGAFPSAESVDPVAESHTIGLFDGPDRPVNGSYPLIWSLESLRLTPGERLVFHGEATDAFNLGSPHVGTSTPRTVTIVSATEKREEVVERQAGLLDELIEIRRDESRLRDALETLLSQWSETDQVRPEDRDQLSHLELEQRRLTARLTDPQQGLQSRAARAGAELAVNRIDDPALSRRLERIGQELATLRDDALPAADRNLTAARKAGDPSESADLEAARANLETILGSIDALLEELGQWRNRRDLAGEVSDLLGVQRELADETAGAASATLGADAGQLQERQQDDLRRLALRQIGLSDRLSRLTEIAEQVSGRSSPTSDPATSDPATDGTPAPQAEPSVTADPQLAKAVERLQEAGLPSMARVAGDSIRANDLGEAGRVQQELLDRLQELQQTLSRSESSPPGTSALDAAARSLDELSRAQQEVLETLRKSSSPGEELSDEERETLIRRQSEIRESAMSAARELRRSGGDEAARATDGAARRMSDGLERLLRQDDESAERALQKALDDLDRARDSAQRDAEEQESKLAQERAAASRDAVSALAARQEAMNRELARLEAAKSAQGRHTRSQLLTLRKTAETQVEIAATTESLADDLDAARAMAFSLRSAATRMRLVEEALRQRDTGVEAQHHGEIAKRRLEQVAAALESMASDTAEQESPPQEGESEPAGGPPGEVVSLLAQLRLAKAIQEDLFQRTESLDRLRQADESREAAARELDHLRNEQSALAGLIRELLATAAGVSEEEMP